jgi:hypothetical protein
MDASGEIVWLQETDGIRSAVMQLAAKYHGIGVVWEHRYYGRSLPFMTRPDVSPGVYWHLPRLTSLQGPNYVGNYTADQWKFLTVDQACLVG